jgi:hypothetical protein
MTKPKGSNSHPGKGESSPYQVRLPGFITDEEVGLGDVIKRTTSYFGVQPCGGCKERRVVLNQWMVFTNGRRR